MSPIVPGSGPEVLDLTAVASSTPSGVLVVGVRAQSMQDAEQWAHGPLPIAQPQRPGAHPSTDAAARRTLIADQQADALYGTTSTRRTHRILPSHDTPVAALELLLGPVHEEDARVQGLLAIHLAAPLAAMSAEDALATHLDLLDQMTRGRSATSDLWTEIRDLMPEGVTLDHTSRMRSVNYAAGEFPEGREKHLAQEWTYRLITATPRDRWPDMAPRARAHPLTIQRPDWSALVLRDGAAFIAHQHSEEPYAEALRVLTHTIHLDAVLLGILQRRLVDQSGARAVHAPVSEPGELVQLERAHFEFKRAYWRTTLTNKRTSPSDRVLQAFQSELLTARDVAEVEERVRDGARLAQALHAERQLESQHRLERTVQIVSVVVGALALAFTAAPTLAQPSRSLFAMAAAVGLLIAVTSYMALRLVGRRRPARRHDVRTARLTRTHGEDGKYPQPRSLSS